MSSPLDSLNSYDAKQLLREKYILILGDSVIRSLYKDLVKFSHIDELLSDEELRIKDEKRFFGDHLISGGIQKGLTNGIDYEEVREYTSGGLLRIRYYFLTRCYSPYLKNVVFRDIENQTIKPDIIIMNSCLWDISRYGIYAMKSYRENLDRIMGSFRQMLPDTLFLWLSALPVSNSSNGGVIVSSAEYLRPILPGLIRDGNYHCSEMCKKHNVLYVDVHTIFSNMLHLRQSDGIHWSAIGNRIINEIILNHIKAYFDGVTNFKNLRLRAELGNKIKIYRQRMKDNRSSTKVNSIDQNVVDNENELVQIEKSLNKTNEIDSKALKRKRKSDNNDETRRKITLKSIVITKQEKMLTIDKSINQVQIKQERLSSSQVSTFNRDFSDTIHDNEFEGLCIANCSGFNVEQSETINGFQSLNYISQIKHEQITMKNNPLDIKPLVNEFTSVPVDTSYNRKLTIEEPEYIIVSSDDDNESTFGIVPTASITSILPIYLLNHHNYD